MSAVVAITRTELSKGKEPEEIHFTLHAPQKYTYADPEDALRELRYILDRHIEEMDPLSSILQHESSRILQAIGQIEEPLTRQMLKMQIAGVKIFLPTAEDPILM